MSARKLTGREADTIIAALNVYIHFLKGEVVIAPHASKDVKAEWIEGLAQNDGKHPKPDAEFLHELADAINLGHIGIQKRYKVRLFGQSEDGERFGIWEGEIEGHNKEEVREEAIEDHWDSRLDTASCKPVVLLTRIRDDE